MSNLSVYLPAVDSSEYSFIEEGETCKEAIHALYTDDFAAPPVHMVIQVATISGKTVKVIIPYDVNGKASVRVDDIEV